MPAGLVPDIYKEPAPVRVVEPERNVIRTFSRNERAAAERDGRSAVDIGCKFFRRTFPPPAPVQFENTVFHFVSLDRLSVGVCKDYRERVVFVGLYPSPVSSRQLYPCVCPVRGEQHGAGHDALVSACFLHSGHQSGLQHARGPVQDRHHYPGGSFAPAVKLL